MAQGQNVITALIIPLSSASPPPRPQPPGGVPGRPDNTLPGSQPGVDNTLPGGQGGRPDNSLPGSQPGIDNTLPGDIPRPEHPIYYPLPPGAPPPQVDNTLPGSQPGVDNTLPGSQPKPDNELPGSQPRPEHPIVLPPGSGGWLPVYIWGPGDARPQPPIELPPDTETEDGREVKFVCGWTPETGWVSVAIVVPGKDHVTPSKSKKK
jgi:hypothetical protein